MGRYVVHDVVSQYPELNSVGVGDYDDRHVVIYRNESPPEELLIHIHAKDGQVNPRLWRPSRLTFFFSF
jgi:hypothetical protein